MYFFYICSKRSLDEIEGSLDEIWVLDIVLTQLMLQWHLYDWKTKFIACVISEILSSWTE